MMNKSLVLLLLLSGLIFSFGSNAQNSMGVGTTTPNSNAVLELVSPNSDQGFLVPRLTTTQRNAMVLSADENGLLVYDSDENSFYFWADPSWAPLGTGGGDMLKLVYDSNEDGIIDGAATVNGLTIETAVPVGAVFTDNQIAAGVPVTPSGNLTSSDVQAALEELQSKIDAAPAGDMLALVYDADADGIVDGAATVNGLTIETAVPAGAIFTDNQIAAGVPVTPTGNIVSTDVQSALEELQTEIDVLPGGDMTQATYDVDSDGVIDIAADATTVNGLTIETAVPAGAIFTDSQPASDVPVTPSGNMTSTDVQAALEELQTDIDAVSIGGGDMTTAEYDADGNSSVDAADSVSVGFFDGLTLTYNPVGNAIEVRDAGIGTAKLEDGAVTSSKIGIAASTGDVLKFDGTSWSGSPEFNSVSVDGATITGDGNGSPLSVGSISTTSINATGATGGEVLRFDGTNWTPDFEDNVVTTDGSTITGDGTGAPLAVGTITATQIGATGATGGEVLRFDGTSWTPDFEDNVVTTDGSTITGDGTGSPLAVGTITATQIGATGATGGEVLRFDGTNWTPDFEDNVVTTDGSTITGDGTGAPLAVGTIASTQIGATGATGGEILRFDGTSWTPDFEDNVVTTDGSTITGDGTGAPLTVGTIASTQIGATGATGGEILRFDGTSWTPDFEDNVVTTDGSTITGDGTGSPLSVGSISTAQITNSSVTAAKLGTASVQTTKIEDGAVTGSKLGIGATNGQVLGFNGSTWLGVTNVSSQWTTNTSNIHYSTGNVGIGIATPGAPLHVETSGTTSSGILIRETGSEDATLTFNETIGANTYSLGIDGSDAGKFKLSKSTNVGGSAIFTIDGNDSFGFGTTTPQDILHAQETSGTISRLRLTHSSSGLSSTDGVVLESNLTNARVRNYETGDLLFTTNGQTATFSSTGNLTVPGIISATGGFSGDGSALTNLPNAFSNLFVSDALTNNITPLAYLSRSDGASAVTINYSNAALPSGFNLGMTASEEFALSAPGANVGLAGDYIRVTNAGDVGIGKAVPTSKLDVDGVVTATDFVYPVGGEKQHVYTVPASAFIVAKNSTTVDHQILLSTVGSEVYVGGSTVQPANMFASVYLPDGATITQVDVSGRNSSADTNMDVDLVAASMSTATTTTPLVSIPTSVSPVTNYSSGVISVPVDLNNYSYMIHVTSSVGAFGITGIKITYTKPSVD
ncbi:MAG: hypothetical protein ABJZ92_09595 [Cyclobacteriaceae bacterium]